MTVNDFSVEHVPSSQKVSMGQREAGHKRLQAHQHDAGAVRMLPQLGPLRTVRARWAPLAARPLANRTLQWIPAVKTVVGANNGRTETVVHSLVKTSFAQHFLHSAFCYFSKAKALVDVANFVG